MFRMMPSVPSQLVIASESPRGEPNQIIRICTDVCMMSPPEASFKEVCRVQVEPYLLFADDQ